MIRKTQTLILIGIIFYLTISLSLLHRPLVGDEPINAADPRMPQFGLSGWHPPLYYDILKILIHFMGITNENLRIFGIICFLITLYLIYLVAQEVSKDRKVGALACILYTIHPLIIQGSLTIDIDNTILTVLLMLFLLYFSRNYENSTLRSNLFLGLLFFICLWAKLSTPILLVISIFLSYIFRRKIKTGIIETFFIVILGVGLFLLLWFIYSSMYNLKFFELFKRSQIVLSSHFSGPTFSGLKELGLRLTRIYLWMGPYFTILWAVIVILRIRDYLVGKREFRLIEFLTLYTLVVFLSYLIIGGTNIGFAKYHYPIVSIMYIIIAEFSLGLKTFKIKKRFMFCLILGFAFILLEWTMVGDLLYEVNYTLRKLMIFAPERLNNFFLDFIKRIILYHFPLITGFILFYFVDTKKDIIKNLVLLLLSLIFISNVSLDVRQIKTDYFTTFCYGRNIREFRQLGDFFKKTHLDNPKGIIIGPEDVLFDAIGHWYPGYTYDIFWSKPDKFLEAIKNEKVSCVAYGFTWNAIYSYKNIFFNPKVLKALEEEYRFYPLGEYSVWLRK